MHAPAQLYQEVCIAEGCSDLGCAHAAASGSPATILLLPPQFSVLNESRLPHLVRRPPEKPLCLGRRPWSGRMDRLTAQTLHPVKAVLVGLKK